RDGATCTATLVADSVIVTAAHCIETEKGEVDAYGVFQTGFARPGGALAANVTAHLRAGNRAETWDNVNSEGTDWALLRIDRPLGAELGFVGVRPLTPQEGGKVLLPLVV